MKNAEIDHQNAGRLNPNAYIPSNAELTPNMAGGLKGYAKGVVRSMAGNISTGTFSELAEGIATYEAEMALYSGLPFRYIALPGLREEGIECTAEGTVRSAIENMEFMQSRFGNRAFASADPSSRHYRASVWRGRLDDDYEIRIRGGSGAGTFSIDFGLGTYDDQARRYNELWRNGIDTVNAEGKTGARFVRTGSGIRIETDFDGSKTASFEEFRKRYKMLPQRMLGLMALYFMRELQPDFAVALTTEGASRFSTLIRSRGSCDYDGIFDNIGFESSGSDYWRYIPNFSRQGFYDALERAGIRKREADALNIAANAINNARTTDGKELPIRLCSDDASETLERELMVHLPKLSKPAIAY